MDKPAIVTDGASDLSRDIIKKYDIITIPYRIFFGDEVYKCWHHDNCSISQKEFDLKLQGCSKEDLPRTSLPTLGEYHTAYEEALEKANSFIAIFLSSKMSGALQTALLVRNNGFKERDISVFDSKSVMSGIGIQVLEAAKLANQGFTKQEIVTKLEEM
ncbi:MAG: DegV family protein, partial [Candidatus Heimdallarchaeota archaeon]